MILAQALAEYGLLAAAATGIERLFNEGTLWLRDAGPGAWIGLAVAGVALLWFLLKG